MNKKQSKITIANIPSISQNNPNSELLTSLKKATSDIDFSYGSESNHPYEFFIWETQTQGKFSINKLLKLIGHQDTNFYRLNKVKNKASLNYKSPYPKEPYFEVDGIEYEIVDCNSNIDSFEAEAIFYSEYEEFDIFFGCIYTDGGIHSEEDFDKYRKFANIITNNLTNIKVFRVGEVQVHLYLIGKAKNDNWVGIHTISIET